MDVRSLTREPDAITAAVSTLRDRLPATWAVELTTEAPTARASVDALIEIVAPDGSRITLVGESKRALLTKDIAGLIDRIGDAQSALPAGSIPLVISRYLSPSVRKELERRDISYVDATGNVRIAAARPALFLNDRGAERDPWRPPGRPRGTLNGPPAARVVRALADFRPPQTARELVARSGASTGAVYRVLDFLDGEALLTRGPRGTIDTVRWRPLLEAWSRDYSFQRDSEVASFLIPRGLPDLLSRLTELDDGAYAVTGSLAAQQWAPYAPARLAMLYTLDTAALVERLDLRAVDGGANVLVAAPTSDSAFARTRTIDGITYCAPSQVAVDLLTGPGRSPAEAQALLDWMESNEPAWRG